VRIEETIIKIQKSKLYEPTKKPFGINYYGKKYEPTKCLTNDIIGFRCCLQKTIGNIYDKLVDKPEYYPVVKHINFKNMSKIQNIPVK